MWLLFSKLCRSSDLGAGGRRTSSPNVATHHVSECGVNTMVISFVFARYAVVSRIAH